MVEGRSNRRYTDEQAVITASNAAGYHDILEDLLPLTEMEKLMGKQNFQTILGGWSVSRRQTHAGAHVGQASAHCRAGNDFHEYRRICNYGQAKQHQGDHRSRPTFLRQCGNPIHKGGDPKYSCSIIIPKAIPKRLPHP